MSKGDYFLDYLIGIGLVSGKMEFGKIETDSRKLDKRDVFIAIYGGNSFVEEALELGASFVVCERDDIKDERVLVVEDTILFLQEFANYYRKRINPVVFAITGSNGKTSVKDILYTILSRSKKGKKTAGNLNNHIGVPLTLLSLEDDDEFIVVEMGMSGFGEIDRLAKISEPDYGIITNIGDSHLEQLGSREGVYRAKTELNSYVRERMVVFGDDDFLKNEDAIKVGFSKNCNYRAFDFLEGESGVVFKFASEGKVYAVKSNLMGEYSVSNILLAIAIAVESGVTIENAVESVVEVEISKMRFEKIEKEGTIYINDAYNASPVSMKGAIKTFSKLYNDRYKIAILGDMLELGEESRKFHEEIGEYIFNEKIDEIYLCGEEMNSFYNKYREKNMKYFETKDKIVEEIEKIKKSKVILLKGSRGMRLEELIK